MKCKSNFQSREKELEVTSVNSQSNVHSGKRPEVSMGKVEIRIGKTGERPGKGHKRPGKGHVK